MNNLKVFSHDTFGDIRIQDNDGEQWFLAKDISDALGYENAARSIQDHVDESDIQKKYIPLLSNTYMLINESGLYSLILGSKKEQAKKFKKWVTAEVLPTIRKEGGYSNTKTLKESSEERAVRLSLLALDMAERWGFEGNQAKLSADRAVRKITGVSPLELMCSKELISETQERTYTPSELGQMLDDKISGIAVNKLLKAQGLQIQEVLKRNDGSTRKKWWELTEKGKDYAVLVDTGKKHSDGTPVQQIKWKKKIIKLLD